MNLEELKAYLEEKYLAACGDIRALHKAQQGDGGKRNVVADTVMAMLAAERKGTVLDIYGQAFPGEPLSRLIERGLAAERAAEGRSGG